MEHFHRYLPISDEARRQGLYVTAGGCASIPPHTPYPPLTHPVDHDFRWTQGRTLSEHQIIYITDGGGTFESAHGGIYPVEAGSLIALFPGEWHRYSPAADTGWDEYWFAFQGDTASRHLGEYSLTRETPLRNVGVDEGVVEEFVHALYELRTEDAGYEKIVAARVLLILARTDAAIRRRELAGSGILKTIEQAKRALLENIAAPMSVKDLASELGVGYSWFRRAFREHTGLAPAQYQLQLRLHRARELLSATTLPIAAVGERCGFASAYSFSHTFKDKTGQTPGEYRRKAQGEEPIKP